MVITSLKTTNNLLNKLISEIFYGDHKRTQQEVPNELLSYLYDIYMLGADDKYSHPKVYVLATSI